MHFLRQPGKCVCMSGCLRQKEWQNCGKNAETYTYQLQHVLILWHDGELQYTLTAKTTREHEIQQEYLQFIGLTVTMEQTLH